MNTAKSICAALVIISFFSLSAATSQPSAFLSKEMISNEPVAANSNTKAAEVSTAAQQKLFRNFSEAQQVRWFILDNNYLAEFNINGIRQKALYSKKGSLLYSIRYAGVNALPKDMYEQVRSNYYDYTITYANEVAVGNSFVWMIGLSNKPDYVTLRVSEDNMEEIEHYNETH